MSKPYEMSLKITLLFLLFGICNFKRLYYFFCGLFVFKIRSIPLTGFVLT